MKVEHPLEDIFGIEKGTTDLPIPQIETTEEVEGDDEDDRVIKQQLNTIYNAALETYQNQYELSQLADPKFAARSAEVGAQFLKIALDAVQGRISNKKTKQVTQKTSNVTNNNLIMNRNDLLNMLKDGT
jgi:hypothetical protein